MTRIQHCRGWGRLGVALIALAWSGVVSPASGSPAPTYVALGDSYASGEGLAPFVGLNFDHCDRSPEAYPYLVASNIGLSAGSANFHDVACAGATLSDLFRSVHGDPSQASAVSSGTNLVSVTIGGNDVGFSALALSCLQLGALAPLATFRQGLCNNAVARAERFLGAVRRAPSFSSSLRPQYRSPFSAILLSALAQLRQRQGLSTPTTGAATWLAVVDYPVLIPPQRSSAVPCQFGDGVTMSARNAGVLRAINELLNREIVSAAKLYATRHHDRGVVPVDVSRALKPLTCTSLPGASDVRSLDVENPRYSLHPLASGQIKMAARVRAALEAKGATFTTVTTSTTTATPTTTTTSTTTPPPSTTTSSIP